MGRKILAAIAGIVSGVIVIGAIEYLSHLAYAPPGTLDTNDAAAVSAFVASLPVGAFLAVLAAYAAGTFVGGWVATRVARAGSAWYAGIIGGLVLAAAFANTVMIPHPGWFVAALPVVVPAAAFLAFGTASRQAGRVNQ